MCFLKDINNKTIQAPSIFYNGNTSSEIVSFQLVFNIIRSSIWNGTGPFYVFNTYEKALKFSLTNYKRYINPSEWNNNKITPTILRVAIFYDSLKGLINSNKDNEAPFSDVELIKFKDKKQQINIDLEPSGQNKFVQSAYGNFDIQSLSSTAVDKYERDINKINALIQLEPLNPEEKISGNVKTPSKQ